MFNNEASLSSLLICKCCNSKLQYPRILPCGKLVCYDCIEMLSSHKRQQFKCPICYKMHLVPKEGFIKSDEITSLVDLTVSEFERNKLAGDLKSITTLIEEKTDSIELNLKIKDHCVKARSDVKMAIEEAHSQIEQIHRELIEQINAYEKEFYEQLKHLNKQEIEKSLSEAKYICEKNKSFLKQNKIDLFQLKKNFNEASDLLNSLLIANEKLESNMINTKVIKFQKNPNFLNSSVVGQIKLQDFQVCFLQNIARSNDFNFEPYINKMSYSLNIMPNGNILIGYKTLRNDLNLVKMNQNSGDVICERNNINKYKICQFETTIANNMIYVCIKEIVKLEETEAINISIYLFDNNLNRINKFDIDDTEFSMTSCFDSIITSSYQEDDFILLTKFNSNFEHSEQQDKTKQDALTKVNTLDNTLHNQNSIFNYLNNFYNLFLPW